MNLIKKTEHGKRINLIIIGAGVAGKLVGEYILKNPNLNYNLLAFVDDDSEKIGGELFEKPILGPIDKIKEIVLDKNANGILIAAPSASGEIIKKLTSTFEEFNLEITILPSSFETSHFLEEEKADFEPVRELRIEDFFRRKPIITNFKKTREYLSEKTILVTGAAGSIGSELCKQLLSLNIKKLIALDNRETALHELNLNLKEKYPEKIIPVIADIRDKQKIKKIFDEFKPSIVFHAAAYKHVPIMEMYPDEAIKTNIFGTKNIIDISDEEGVSDFILISTDKAVNPKSVMGMTKRIAEIILQTKCKTSKTKFVSVRFGNVINSDGSAIPLFLKQIERGGPVTITHPDVKRFFMTIPEAVQLVIQSISLGKSGNLFMLDMGEQFRILDLIEEMIKLKGLKPYTDIPIHIMGLRPGEKMTEELINSNEKRILTENERIFLLENECNFNESKLEEDLNYLKNLLDELDLAKIIFKLNEMAIQ